VNPLDLGPRVERLAAVPVTLKGGPLRGAGAAQGSAWRGVAHAAEPLVAVAFLTTPRGKTWVKSRRCWGNAVLVEIGLYGDPTAGHLRITLAPRVWPEVREGTSEEVLLRARGAVPPAGEVQVPIDGWWWQRQTSEPVWGCPHPHEVIDRRFEVATGVAVRTMAAAEAGIAVDLLFLPRRETRTRRLGIWSLKTRCRDEVPEPLRHVLCFGRSGRWPPERRNGQRYGP